MACILGHPTVNLSLAVLARNFDSRKMFPLVLIIILFFDGRLVGCFAGGCHCCVTG